MQQSDKEINNKSIVYFYTPSAMAREFLYYPLAVGIYEKGNNYHIHRKRYDSVMLAYITDGNLQLDQGNLHFRAEKGDILLVDCYREHEYYTDSFVKFTWLHIDGSSLRSWLEHMIGCFGQCMKASPHCHPLMLSVINGIKDGEDQYRLSKKIHSLMCEIASFKENAEADSSIIRQAKDYIEEHLEEKLSVKQIAEQMHYSPSYFSQMFRQSVKMPPYEYLLSRRIERAKELLLQTDFPLEIVATRSGFQEITHFIYTFKKFTGLSPLKFRKIGL